MADLNLVLNLPGISSVDSGGVGGARATPEFESSEKGQILISGIINRINRGLSILLLYFPMFP